MNREVRNVAASVRARLLEGAKARGEEFALTLQRYAADDVRGEPGTFPG